MRRLSLIIVWIITSPLAAQPEQGIPVASTETGKNWEDSVTGFGLTFEVAQKEALNHIAKKIVAFVRSQDPPLLAWQPTHEYIKAHVLLGDGAQGKDYDLGGVTSKRWIYPVKPLDLDSLRQLDQEAQRALRRHDRIIWAAQWLAGYVLLLGVVAGYLRLNDSTHGRYRTRLRFASGALLLVAALGWWWLR